MTLRARRSAATAAVLLATGSLLLVQAPFAQADEGTATTCHGQPVTIAGTPGPDVKIGTFGKDVISTLGGTDVVRGDADFGGFPGGDSDTICLGPGDDVADGAAKSDLVDGGSGNDVLDGDNFPSPYADTLIGGDGNDIFTGGMGNDIINGGAGNDIVDPPGAGIGAPPSAGADTIDAGPGDDVITEQLDGGIDTIDAGPGNDRCVVDTADVVKNCETVIRVPAGG